MLFLPVAESESERSTINRGSRGTTYAEGFVGATQIGQPVLVRRAAPQRNHHGAVRSIQCDKVARQEVKVRDQRPRAGDKVLGIDARVLDGDQLMVHRHRVEQRRRATLAQSIHTHSSNGPLAVNLTIVDLERNAVQLLGAGHLPRGSRFAA